MKIGTGELLLILVVALLVLGPEKMPGYAKKIGKALNSLKGYVGEMSEAIKEDIVEPLEEVQKPLKKATEPLENISKNINKPMEEIKKSINDIGKTKEKVKVNETHTDKEIIDEDTELNDGFIEESKDLA